MKISDPSQVMLASGSTTDCGFGIWKLSDILSYKEKAKPQFFDKEHHKSSVRTVSWNPSQIGLLATGGSSEDRIIRLWDFKDEKNQLLHTFQCNNSITSLCWRKGMVSLPKD